MKLHGASGMSGSSGDDVGGPGGVAVTLQRRCQRAVFVISEHSSALYAASNRL